MRRTWFAFVLFVFAMTTLVAVEVQVVPDELVFVVTPDDWRADAGPRVSTTFPYSTIRLSAPGDRNVVVLISVLDKDREEFRNEAFLANLLRGDSRPYVGSSKELSSVEMKKMHIAAGVGLFANFIDPDLVGRPIQKGKFKTATPVIIGLGNRYLIKATILCDDLTARDYREAMDILRTISARQ